MIRTLLISFVLLAFTDCYSQDTEATQKKLKKLIGVDFNSIGLINARDFANGISIDGQPIGLIYSDNIEPTLRDVAQIKNFDKVKVVEVRTSTDNKEGVSWIHILTNKNKQILNKWRAKADSILIPETQNSYVGIHKLNGDVIKVLMKTSSWTKETRELLNLKELKKDEFFVIYFETKNIFSLTFYRN